MSRPFRKVERDFWRAVRFDREGRVHELLERHRMIMQSSGRGTFGHLFKTKRNARKREHAQKIVDHIAWIITTKIPDIDEWMFEARGRNPFDRQYTLFFSIKGENYFDEEDDASGNE